MEVISQLIPGCRVLPMLTCCWNVRRGKVDTYIRYMAAIIYICDPVIIQFYTIQWSCSTLKRKLSQKKSPNSRFSDVFFFFFHHKTTLVLSSIFEPVGPNLKRNASESCAPVSPIIDYFFLKNKIIILYLYYRLLEALFLWRFLKLMTSFKKIG